MLMYLTTIPATLPSNAVLPADDPSRFPQPVAVNPATIRDIRPRLRYIGRPTTDKPHYVIDGTIITNGDGEEGILVAMEPYKTVIQLYNECSR